jgi:alpha-tubulin suppressor-like RCC1 family protein
VLDENQSIYTPIKIPYFEKHSLKIVKVSCGELHSIALTESNQIFTWGYGEHGRLGHGDEEERYEPTELKFRFKYVFKDVFAGSDCSFLLTKDGRVLAFGNNEFNKLCLNEITIGFKSDLKNIQGVSSIVQQLTPKIIKKLSPYHVVKICPGKTHTAAIDRKLSLIWLLFIIKSFFNSFVTNRLRPVIYIRK